VAEFYKKAGYHGFCLTDHFAGYSTLPDSTPWKQRVDFFYNTYERAREAGERLGLSVFFGIEYGIARDVSRMSRATGNDFIILNLTRDWLLQNRDAFTKRTKELFHEIRCAGGFIIHAHPFNEKPWVEYIRLLPYSVDAVEVINAMHPDFVNENARKYAETYNLLQVAGTDCHRPDVDFIAGVETDEPCCEVIDLIRAIRQKRAAPFKEAFYS